MSHFIVRPLKEFLEQAKLVEQVESGRMNRIATEIPEKITVLLKDDYVDAGAGQEVAKHHTGGTATNDTATSVQLIQVGSPWAHSNRSKRL
jgi:hypothetical protein